MREILRLASDEATEIIEAATEEADRIVADAQLEAEARIQKTELLREASVATVEQMRERVVRERAEAVDVLDRARREAEELLREAAAERDRLAAEAAERRALDEERARQDRDSAAAVAAGRLLAVQDEVDDLRRQRDEARESLRRLTDQIGEALHAVECRDARGADRPERPLRLLTAPPVTRGAHDAPEGAHPGRLPGRRRRRGDRAGGLLGGLVWAVPDVRPGVRGGGGTASRHRVRQGRHRGASRSWPTPPASAPSRR